MLEKLLETATERIECQNNACDAIDQKIGTLIGFSGVILTVAVGFNRGGWTCWEQIIFRVGCALVLISIVVLYFGYRRTSLSLGLSINELIKLVQNKTSEKMFLYIQINYLNEAYKENKDKLATKNLFLGRGALILMLGVVFLVSITFI